MIFPGGILGHMEQKSETDEDRNASGMSLCPCLPFDSSTIGSSAALFPPIELQPLSYCSNHLLGSYEGSRVVYSRATRMLKSSREGTARVKLMCSFGGRILPRPSDGKLRCVGGETRIAFVNRNINYRSLVAKMKELYVEVHLVKYQIPGEELDALVSVCNDEDLENMMEEYDAIKNCDRLRVFLLPLVEREADPGFDPKESEQLYIDAVNGNWGKDDWLESGSAKSSSALSVMQIKQQSLEEFTSSPTEQGTPLIRVHSSSNLSATSEGQPRDNQQQRRLQEASKLDRPALLEDDVVSQMHSSTWCSTGHLSLSSPCLCIAVKSACEQQQHGCRRWLSAYDRSRVVFPCPSCYCDGGSLLWRQCQSCQHCDFFLEPQQLNESGRGCFSSSSKPATFIHHEGIGECSRPSWFGRTADQQRFDSRTCDQAVVIQNFHKEKGQSSREPDGDGGKIRVVERQGRLAEEEGSMSHGNSGSLKAGARNPAVAHTYVDHGCLSDSQPNDLSRFSQRALFPGDQVSFEFQTSSSLHPANNCLDNPARISTAEATLQEWETPLCAVDAMQSFVGEKIELTAEEPNGEKEGIASQASSVLAPETEAISRRLQTIKNADLEDIRELGLGTFGTVYYGKWRGSDVAIKRIKPSCFDGNPSDRNRLISDFWREAGTLGQLHHPNVVAFYGVVPDGPDGTLATVTEYMVNGSLKQVLRRKDRTIDRRKRLLIATDAAFGMEYLHSKRIVHFDLKCENLLVNMRDPHRPVCKVGDFGLSKVKHRTMVSGGFRGTLPWMAPELLNGGSNMVTEKVDVFSFGIVMWELLTGEEPYASMHHGAIIGGILSNSLRPSIPGWCDPLWRCLMERCWTGDPSQRPSFSQVAIELRAMTSVPLQPKT